MSRTKFNVSKDKTDRTYEGIVFDSVMEMEFYRDVLIPNLENGNITKVSHQVPFVLQKEFYNSEGKKISAVKYVADFCVDMTDGRMLVIDVKGHADAVALLKRKMFYHQYPLLFYRWVTYSKIDGGWVDWDIVQKNRAERRRARKRKELENKLNEEK